MEEEKKKYDFRSCMKYEILRRPFQTDNRSVKHKPSRCEHVTSEFQQPPRILEDVKPWANWSSCSSKATSGVRWQECVPAHPQRHPPGGSAQLGRAAWDRGQHPLPHPWLPDGGFSWLPLLPPHLLLHHASCPLHLPRHHLLPHLPGKRSVN